MVSQRWHVPLACALTLLMGCPRPLAVPPRNRPTPPAAAVHVPVPSTGAVVIAAIDETGSTFGGELPPMMDDIRKCHEEARGRDAEHAGWVLVSVQVRHDGQVGALDDVRTGGIQAVALTCVLDAVRKARWQDLEPGWWTLYVGLH